MDSPRPSERRPVIPAPGTDDAEGGLGGGGGIDRTPAAIRGPMSLCLVDRCVLCGGIMTVTATLFVVATTFAAGWPFLPPGVQPIALELLARLSRGIVAAWLALFLLGLALRRRAPESRLLVQATIQLYAVSIGVFTYLTGPFHSPGWIGFLGGTIVGFLLFDRRSTVLGVGTYYLITFGTAYGGTMGALPYAPLLRTFAKASGDVGGAWAWRLGVSSFASSMFIILLTGEILSSWRRREARLEWLSRTDGLTGVRNRLFFMEAIEREVLRARRYDAPLACVLLDIDHFKRVNDTYGHLTGDKVLGLVATRIQRTLRDVDVVARYGGEEFAILLPNTHARGAEEVAQRCRRLIDEARLETGVGIVAITASLGVSSMTGKGDETSTEDLLRRADEALYRAKEAGRNRVELAPPSSRRPPPPAEGG